MQIKLHRIFLILTLALVMTSGSFYVSMAEETNIGNETQPHEEMQIVELDPAALEPDINFEEVVNINGHNVSYFIEIHTYPSCTGKGSYSLVRKCRNSGCTLQDSVFSSEDKEIKALGHTFADPVKEVCKEPTCTEEGCCDKVEYCSVCGEELSREHQQAVIKALGHTPAESVEENRVEPTCTEEGSYDEVVYCSVCDEELTRTTIAIPAQGHSPGDWVVEKEATTKAEGLRVRKCTSCGAVVESKPIAKLQPEVTEHTPSYVTVEGSFGSFEADIDDKGNAVLKDFFWKLEEGSEAEESVTMSVGAKSYTITRYADGTVIGQLPPRFSVSGRDLKISGLKGDLDIQITSHTALGGGASSDPYNELPAEGAVGDESFFEELSYEEPAVSAQVDAVSSDGEESISYRAVRESGSTGGDTVIAYYAEAPIDNAAVNIEDNAAGTLLDKKDNKDTKDTTEKKPSASSFFKADPNNVSDGGLILSGGDSGAPSSLVVVADIALISALILGIVVLWKLGILKLR